MIRSMLTLLISAPQERTAAGPSCPTHTLAAIVDITKLLIRSQPSETNTVRLTPFLEALQLPAEKSLQAP